MNPNWAHLHLIGNHLPLFAALTAVLLLGAGLIGKSAPLSRAGLIACLLAGLGTWAAVYSGERAEDWVIDKPGVTEEVIEEHEEAAETSRYAAFPLGALALVTLFWRSGPQRPLQIVLLLLALATTGLMGKAANLGGQIRHTEVRDGAVEPGAEAEGGVAVPAAGEAGEQEEERDGHGGSGGEGH